MRDIALNLNDTFETSALGRFLGEETAAELRHDVKELILEQMRRDFESAYEYTLCPNDVQCLVNDILEEVRETVLEEYKDKMVEKVMQLTMDNLGKALLNVGE